MSVGQWAVLLVWVSLDGIRWSRVASLTCLEWLGWLGPLSIKTFVLQGADLGVLYCGRRVSSNKTGQIQSTFIFQASAYVIFTNVLLAKASPIGFRAWVQRGMIYGGHYCNVLSQHVPSCHSNPEVPKLGLRCSGMPWWIHRGYCGIFLNFEGNIIIFCWTSCKLDVCHSVSIICYVPFAAVVSLQSWIFGGCCICICSPFWKAISPTARLLLVF